MAREPGVRYLHVFYEKEPDENGIIVPHDLRSGCECPCEPKGIRAGNTIIVIHDPEDGLFVVEDKNGYQERERST